MPTYEPKMGKGKVDAVPAANDVRYQRGNPSPVIPSHYVGPMTKGSRSPGAYAGREHTASGHVGNLGKLKVGGTFKTAEGS